LAPGKGFERLFTSKILGSVGVQDKDAKMHTAIMTKFMSTANPAILNSVLPSLVSFCSVSVVSCPIFFGHKRQPGHSDSKPHQKREQNGWEIELYKTKRTTLKGKMNHSGAFG
jgi:hypothetical protein